MATLTLTTIAADVRTAQIEAATWRARKALAWWAGEHLSDKQRARLLEDIVEFIATNEPQNCPVAAITNAMFFKGHQCNGSRASYNWGRDSMTICYKGTLNDNRR